MKVHPDFQAILDQANAAELRLERARADEVERLRKRYKAMSPQEIYERAIFLEGCVLGLTGEAAPETELPD